MATKCSVDNCPQDSRTRGWCKPHYDAWYRHGDPLAYRGDRSHLSIWQKIQEIGWTRTASGCLEYNGYRNELGYGQFREQHTNALLRVHRVVYGMLVAPLSAEDKVLHRCDNPPCSEPTHLLKGTQADNIHDMMAKGRNYKADWLACPNGHPYPEDRPASISSNRCKQCARDRNRRYHERKRVVYGGEMAVS